MFQDPTSTSYWAIVQWKSREQLRRAAALAATSPTLQVAGEASKPAGASRTEAVYQFRGDETLADAYKNPWGGLRLGRVLEDLDALAGSIAFKHCCVNGDGSVRPLLLVTASVDRISVNGALPRPNAANDVLLAGSVIWTGKSSIEIRMFVKDETHEESW
eukprot:scaffold1850_cov194-Pinguiococcus_pyrenoidosus.AAC.47